MSKEIQEIRSLISSDNKSKKSSGYSSLLRFQRHSCINASSLQSLALSAQSIISSIFSDIFDNHDEEIATQALKCLGFMLYHPSIVSVLRVNDANLVLSTLPKLITTTKLKASLMFFLLLISEKASAMRTSLIRLKIVVFLIGLSAFARFSVISTVVAFCLELCLSTNEALTWGLCDCGLERIGFEVELEVDVVNPVVEEV
ncbi:hypothetical protein VNO80_24324 [Phaseolus coccineus]|uniref:Uncharacterized protein n=1 Tax=Phaseolus coccineus TaxID=3886 RepID=A0AAN9LSA0_PHACN